jgi:hypothetical protein
MEAKRFDQTVRALTASLSRRRSVASLTVGLLSALVPGLAPGHRLQVAAKKGKKGKGKKVKCKDKCIGNRPPPPNGGPCAGKSCAPGQSCNAATGACACTTAGATTCGHLCCPASYFCCAIDPGGLGTCSSICTESCPVCCVKAGGTCSTDIDSNQVCCDGLTCNPGTLKCS